MKKALFVHNNPMTFVRLDRDLLARHYDLTEHHFHWQIRPFLQMLKQVIFSEVIFAWFASHHSFFPTILGRLLRKKIIIFAADYDLANEPAYKYGSMRGGIRKWVNNMIFRAAHAVIVPSEFSRELALKNTVLTPEKVYVIYLGIPITDPVPVSKKSGVVTIAKISEESVWRKGLTTFVEMGKYIPEIQCYLVGQGPAELMQMLAARKSENVTLTGFLSENELNNLLGRAAVYVQLSYMEGFGLAVIEAMMRGCIPVVTDRGALREVVGECGIYVPYNNPEAAARGIREALNQPGLGEAARQHVIHEFPLKKREEKLLALLESLNAL